MSAIRNDWPYYQRADVLAKLGFTVEWNYGTKPEYIAYFAHWPGFWMWARPLPWLDPPADMANWPADRYVYRGIGTLDGKQTYGPAYPNGDGSVSFRGTDGSYFIAPEPTETSAA